MGGPVWQDKRHVYEFTASRQRTHDKWHVCQFTASRQRTQDKQHVCQFTASRQRTQDKWHVYQFAASRQRTQDKWHVYQFTASRQRTQDKWHVCQFTASRTHAGQTALGAEGMEKLSGALPLVINWCINGLSEGVGPTVLNSQNCRDAWVLRFGGGAFRMVLAKLKKKKKKVTFPFWKDFQVWSPHLLGS